MEKYINDAIMENLEDMIQFVLKNIDNIGGNQKKLKNKIRLACEEVFVNVINYAYENKPGKIEILYDENKGKNEFEITVIDQGKEFNPIKKEDPNTELAMEDRQIGGLGIFMVKKIMDEVDYERKEGKNILRMVKSV